MTCRRCNGRGGEHICTTCDGTGERWCVGRGRWVMCETCDGYGVVGTCPACNGTGMVSSDAWARGWIAGLCVALVGACSAPSYRCDEYARTYWLDMQSAQYVETTQCVKGGKKTTIINLERSERWPIPCQLPGRCVAPESEAP